MATKQTVEKWIAEDGTQFDTEKEAEDYDYNLWVKQEKIDRLNKLISINQLKGQSIGDFVFAFYHRIKEIMEPERGSY